MLRPVFARLWSDFIRNPGESVHERLQEILNVHTFVQNDFDSKFITKPVGSVTTAVQFDASSK